MNTKPEGGEHSHPLPTITFEEYILKTNDFAVYPDVNTGLISELAYIGIALTGEGGELGNVIKKIMRNGPATHFSVYYHPDNVPLIPKIKEEMGDVLWYYARLCQFFGWTLEEIMQENIDKLQGRKDTGTLKVHK